MNGVMSSDPLNRELAIYESNKQYWLATHLNEFVVIAGEETQGFYPDYESAFKAGIAACGIMRPFLIKQICVTEPVYVVY
jgi:hypothetical protein